MLHWSLQVCSEYSSRLCGSLVNPLLTPDRVGKMKYKNPRGFGVIQSNGLSSNIILIQCMFCRAWNSMQDIIKKKLNRQMEKSDCNLIIWGHVLKIRKTIKCVFCSTYSDVSAMVLWFSERLYKNGLLPVVSQIKYWQHVWQAERL